MYGDVSGWIAYAALRGLTVADDAASAAALVRASDYIRTQYVLPRTPEYDATSDEVIEGSYMAAPYELSKPGFFAATVTPGARVKSAGAGPAKVEFFESSSKAYAMEATKIIAAIDALFSRNSMLPAVYVV